MLRAFGVSDKGSVRPANEDCFAIHEELGLIVVADGMGGANAGEIAARMAVEALVEHVATASEDWPFGFDPSLSNDANQLRTAILLANIQILEAATTTARCAGMGTTIVAARVRHGQLIVGHVGDSRLYVLSAGLLEQITEDDSWVQSMRASNPGADLRALDWHPMRDALTNVVGASARTDVHVVQRRIDVGDALLLTTDGVHGVVDNQRMAQLMRRSDAPRTIAEHLVATALARGTRDNCTAVVARYH